MGLRVCVRLLHTIKQIYLQHKYEFISRNREPRNWFPVVETHFTTTEKYLIKHDHCCPTTILVSGGGNRFCKHAMNI